MNKEIKELALQAGFCGENLENTQFGTCHQTALEIFALLITKKCADAADMFPTESIYVGDYVMESMGYCPAEVR